ncbi:MAG: RHS repeat-associated core domain-containing protein [Oceanospirillaceae bacterium]|nr:RHS repeat-associated core domain-containing protein [Oceanospirillaceae bacterium]
MRTNTGNALQAGWNQSVLPISAPVATADYVKNNPLSSIWYFSQAEQRWYYWVKGQGGSLAQLQPGQIYWLLSPRAQTLAQDYGLCGAKGCEMYFQHSDHLGSVLLETRSDGSVNQRSRYRPYGAPVGEQQTKPYSFSAKEQDLSGLYYFEARYYDPLSARFISPDPLFATAPEKCVQSVVECNLYQYAGNSPLVLVDLSGLEVSGGYAVPGVIPPASYSNDNKIAEGLMYYPIAAENSIRSGLNAGINLLGVVGDALPDPGTIQSAGMGNPYTAGIGFGLAEGVAGLRFLSSVSRAAIAARAEAGVAIGAARTNAQLVQEVATRADRWGNRQGLFLGPRAGTLKHGYADELLTRYQNIYGQRGLKTETSWIGNAPATYGTRGSVRLDVWEPATGTVFDYKFGNAVLTVNQVNKITTQGPLGIQQVIQVKP